MRPSRGMGIINPSKTKQRKKDVPICGFVMGGEVRRKVDPPKPVERKRTLI